MPDEKKETTEQRDPRGNLEALAQSIATEVGDSESERDSVTMVLAKGLSDALTGLIPSVMLKGKAADAPKGTPTEASGKTDNEDDYDEESEGDEKIDEQPGAGYEDMRMGDYGDDEFVDATEFLGAMHRENLELRKMVKGLGKKIAGLERLVVERDNELRSSLVQVFAPMSKAVIGTHKLLEDTPMVPASLANPTTQGKLRLIRESLDSQAEKSEIDVVQLSKARQKNIITEEQLTYWKQTGKFSSHEDQAAELHEAVKAL